MDKRKKQLNKRRMRQISGSSNVKKNTPKSKKMKSDSNATIDMSQQLLMKKQTQVRKRKTNQPLRTLPNGKPMPSLADLEKMFEDTDTDEQMLSHPVSEVPKTPTKNSITANGDMVLSPNTVKNISNRLMDMITKVKNPRIVLTKEAVPTNIMTTHELVPIVHPKKKKKYDSAYIERCNDSDQVLTKGSYLCKDDAESNVKKKLSDDKKLYPIEVDVNSNDAEFSKSMLNAQSNYIAKILTEIEITDNKSSDSNKTEDYDYTANIAKNNLLITSSPLPLKNNDLNRSPKIFESNKKLTKNNDTFIDTKIIKLDKDTHSYESDDSNKTVDYEPSVDLIGNNSEVLFSPLPSTSRDNKTFIENDLLYNKSLSLTANSAIAGAVTENEDDVQIIETPSETIIIKDETDHSSIRETSTEDSVNIIEPINSKSLFKYPNKVNDDDCIILIDDNYNTCNSKDDIPTYVIDDEYANVEIDKELNINTDEIIDIDELIEENEIIIGKLSETKRSSSVIEVIEIPNSQSPNIENIKANIISIPDDNSDNHRNVNKRSQSYGANVPSSSSSLGTFHIIEKIVKNYFNNTFNTLHLSRLHKKHTPQQKYNRGSNNFNSSVEEIQSDGIFNLQFPNINFTINPSTQHTLAKKSSMKSKTNNSKNIGDCPICMDSLNANTIASTICGHVFCLSCIQVSTKKHGKRCPTCRKPLKGIGYHQLYL